MSINNCRGDAIHEQKPKFGTKLKTVHALWCTHKLRGACPVTLLHAQHYIGCFTHRKSKYMNIITLTTRILFSSLPLLLSALPPSDSGNLRLWCTVQWFPGPCQTPGPCQKHLILSQITFVSPVTFWGYYLDHALYLWLIWERLGHCVMFEKSHIAELFHFKYSYTFVALMTP